MRSHRGPGNNAFVLAVLIATFLVSGCEPQAQKKRSKKGVSTRSVAVGNLIGSVRLAGSVLPEATRVQNATDPEVCGPIQTVEVVQVSSENRGIADVIVALNGVPLESIPPFEPSRLVLDNKDCRFYPHVGVLEVGGTIVAENSDPILHTTHLYGTIEANLSLPFKGVSSSRTIHTPGMIIVKCDIHGWMQAFVRVDNHPFHTVSGSNGSFRISNIPSGSYELEVWHEKLGLQRRAVLIEEGQTERIEIEYSLPES